VFSPFKKLQDIESLPITSKIVKKSLIKIVYGARIKKSNIFSILENDIVFLKKMQNKSIGKNINND
jgi:hypothetical protein